MSIEDDPILGQFVDTAEKKAKWMHRLKIAQLFWLLFVIIGILSLLIWWALHY